MAMPLSIANRALGVIGRMRSIAPGHEDRAAFQAWLVAQGADIAVDGWIGKETLTAIDRIFSNRSARAIHNLELLDFADRLGGSVKQLKAVAAVESNGGGFDAEGRRRCFSSVTISGGCPTTSLASRHSAIRSPAATAQGDRPGAS